MIIANIPYNTPVLGTNRHSRRAQAAKARAAARLAAKRAAQAAKRKNARGNKSPQEFIAGLLA